MRIAAFVRNLLFADRLEAAARLRGDDLVPAGAGALGPADLVVLDLAEPGWDSVAALARESGIPVLAFGPHVRSDLFAAARELGVGRAVANSKFAQALPELLADLDAGNLADHD